MVTTLSSYIAGLRQHLGELRKNANQKLDLISLMKISDEELGKTYLLQKIENPHPAFGWSYSNRYMNWRIRNSIIASFSKEKRRPLKCLEVGCFEGNLLFLLNNLFNSDRDIEFIGGDLSPKGIALAQRRSDFFKLSNRIKFQVMDANKLPFDDNTFDVLICSEVLEHLENPEIAINEFYRVLKPGGLAIITTPNKGLGILGIASRILNSVIKSFKAKNSRFNVPICSGQREKGVGFGHISEKSSKEWTKIFKNKFYIQRRSGTGGILFGGPELDRHPLLFSLIVIFETIFGKLPFAYCWAQTAFFELRKNVNQKLD